WPMPLLRIGHSPDADDAFMFYALSRGHVTIPGFRTENVLADIETLNARAIEGDLEVTALSAAAYPRVAQRYRLLRTGASVGRGYGPVLISARPLSPAELARGPIAIPGWLTTAFLLTMLYLEPLRESPRLAVALPFDRIAEAVLKDEVVAGLLIHEGQITYGEVGFHKVLDLGELWQQETGLPLPLGVNAVRRDLGEEVAAAVSRGLRQSIDYALAHEEDALSYALEFGRGIDREVCRRFVRMYVNEDTQDLGEEGLAALEALYRRALEHRLITAMPPLDVI
ncbi:MAG TPA: MqnA/MqnD/SBP family protein, partial [Dehalococcoidia bacterium]|nr:MqnA/MqnD/SBP family protein [Dehalococcoidia bacterium]